MKVKVNIPNTLSGLRIFFIPVIFWLIINSNRDNFPILLFIFLFSVGLDFLDGYLARKLSQETELGKILDPIADKLMLFFVILALILKSNFPIWLGVLVIGRDMVILLASFLLMKGKKARIPASILIGKITFAFFAGLIFVFILDLHQDLILEPVKRFFVITCSGFLIWSSYEYYCIFKKERNHEKEKTYFNY